MLERLVFDVVECMIFIDGVLDELVPELDRAVVETARRVAARRQTD
jgi:hypothetical protein